MNEKSLGKSNSFNVYSHLSNSQGGWDKHGGGAKAATSINVEGVFLEKNST